MNNANNDTLKCYFNQLKSTKLLTQEEEVELAKKIEEGNKDAWNTLINNNLKLVIKIAKRYISYETNLLDLIQEGNIGLMRAAEKFDYRKNVRFSTYAALWIKQSILRALNNKKRLIRLPLKKEERLRKINLAINELTQELNRTPTVYEIAEKTSFSIKDIFSLKNLSENFVSIDSDIDDEGNTFAVFLNDDKFSPEKLIIDNDVRKLTEQVVDTLKLKERNVIMQRYALGNGQKLTLKTIARNLGISPETVRQIERRAMNKIRVHNDYLRDYIYS